MNVRLGQSYEKKVKILAEERKLSQTELVKGFIDANYYMSRPEIVKNSVNLMEAIEAVREQCDSESWNNLKKAGTELCQSLLTK